MRISDWSSDVCSSDLPQQPRRGARERIDRRSPCPSQATARSGLTPAGQPRFRQRSEEHTSELQSLMRISYAVFCLKKKPRINTRHSLPYHPMPSDTTYLTPSHIWHKL